MTQYFILILAAISASNCVYYFIFSKFTFFKIKDFKSQDFEPTSVVVYIKNQETILLNFLEKLKIQNHPNFEVILVNNASSDNSLTVLEEFVTKDSRFKIVNVENNEAFWGSKKYALTLGIKKASNSNLLFTTPDVIDVSEEWISKTSSLYSKQKQVVLGYVNYKKSSGFFNKALRYSRLFTNFQNFGWAAINKPFFGWENNLGYTSKLFFEQNGFSSHMSITTGTEDLFVKQATNSKNVALALDSRSFVSIDEKVPLGEWIEKRSNQLKHYSSGIKVNLGLFYISQLMFYIFAISLGILVKDHSIYLIIAIRFVLVWLIMSKVAFKFLEKDLVYFFPLWEIFNICLQIPIFIKSLSSK